MNCKIVSILHHPYCCCVYIPCTTCLHIPLAHPYLYYYYLLSPQYTYCTFYFIAHFTLYFLFLFLFVTYIYVYPLVLCYMAYISLLIIFCIIEYVTDKKTLNLEPCGAKAIQCGMMQC